MTMTLTILKLMADGVKRRPSRVAALVGLQERPVAVAMQSLRRAGLLTLRQKKPVAVYSITLEGIRRSQFAPKPLSQIKREQRVIRAAERPQAVAQMLKPVPLAKQTVYQAINQQPAYLRAWGSHVHG